MKQKIVAGGELDLLTFSEIAPIINFLDSLKPATFSKTAVVTSSATGAINAQGLPLNAIKLYAPPEGRKVRLLRISIDSISVVPSTPLTQGWIRILHNDSFTGSNCITFAPQNGQVAPISVDYNSSSSPVIRDGIYIIGAGLPAATEFNFSLVLSFADVGSAQ